MTTQTWNSDGYVRNARFVTDLGIPVLELLVADAARCEVLELESGALKHASERFIGAQSRRNSVRSLITHNPGDIDELQAGLAGERSKRLREGLCRNIGGERRGFGLCQHRRSIQECSGRADRERAENPRHRCRDTR
jgi:hypothetical protein